MARFLIQEFHSADHVRQVGRVQPLGEPLLHHPAQFGQGLQSQRIQRRVRTDQNQQQQRGQFRHVELAQAWRLRLIMQAR